MALVLTSAAGLQTIPAVSVIKGLNWPEPDLFLRSFQKPIEAGSSV
jgi:hypothetical protein